MACETTSTNLTARNRTAARMTTEVAAAGLCTACGKCCCNCSKCVAEKGALNICAKCQRAKVELAKKEGA